MSGAQHAGRNYIRGGEQRPNEERAHSFVEVRTHGAACTVAYNGLEKSLADGVGRFDETSEG